MKFLRKQRLARVSPWVLAAACGLLTLIIAVFAVNNYRRDKALMTDILLEKGATLIRFVASSSRSSVLGGLRAGKTLETLWPENVQRVLEHASGHPGVAFLALVNDQGMVIANSVPEDRNRMVSSQTRSFIAALEEDSLGSRTFSFRIANDKKTPVFQIAAMLPPMGKGLAEQMAATHRRSMKGMGGGLMSARNLQEAFTQNWIRNLKEFSEQRFVILVELDMAQFNQRLQRQKLEIIILSIVLLLVGIGGWLSILTLEGLKGSQSRLRHIEAFRDILISSLPVGLIATDSNGKVILYNRFSQEFTGITEEHAMDADSNVFQHLPEISAAFGGSGTVPAGAYQKEVQIENERGEQHTLQLNRLSIVDREDKFAGTLLLMQDLSQVKKLEEELRRSERLAALGKMAAGVAHELRNPLSSIKGLALVLQSRFREDNEDRETATILVQEVERLNRSISELLVYARPQQLKKSIIDITRVLNKSVSLMRIDAETAGVELLTFFQDGLPSINADEDKLTQVILNLLLNGIQSMEDGGTLDIRVGATDRKIEIMVTDSGCGISEDDLGRVFDPYFTTKPDGTGLGMAMSAKIIEEHGGEIRLQSKVGQGTSVIIEIPC
jgi:two-component system, NtrC family, sensor histidine kinase HydH